MARSRMIRVLHMPVGSGRQAWGLSRAERELGLKSDFVAFESFYVKLPCDRLLFEEGDGILTQEIKRWRFFLESVFKYDVFHFHFGQKFFVLNPRPFKAGDGLTARILRFAYWTYSLIVGRLDLWVLCLFGKKMFMTYHGDDVRQGDLSRKLFPIHFVREVGPDYYDDYSDARKRRNAKIFARFCRQVYVVTPDLLPMSTPGTQLLRHTGVDPRDWQVSNVSNRIPLVIHAPTHREVKGTKYILEAVESLKQRGLEFEFKLVERMSNDEAKRWYAKADLVIDQLFLGWYGVLALECMAMGKPVICYIRDSDADFVWPNLAQENPVISASPENIERVLAACLTDMESTHSIGVRSRAFVEKWYRPIDIARPVIERYVNG